MTSLWEVLETHEAVWREVIEEGEIVEYLNSYKICEVVGKGSFGRVHRCIRCRDNNNTGSDDVYAIKFLSKNKLRKTKTCVTSDDGDRYYITALQRLHDEVSLMRQLYHRNTLLMFELIDDPNEDRVAMVLEWAVGGEVMHSCVTTDNFVASFIFSDAARQMTVMQLANDLIMGVKHLHSLRIAHMDIKPSNLLLAANTTPSHSSPFVLRIADFASALQFSAADIVSASPGTIAFWAPECVTNSHRGVESAVKEEDDKIHSSVRYSAFGADCWAVGLTLHCFLFRHLPYTTAENDDKTNILQLMRIIEMFDISTCDELQQAICCGRDDDDSCLVAKVEMQLLQRDVSVRYDMFAAAADIDTELPP